jgi:hypothetical protein
MSTVQSYNELNVPKRCCHGFVAYLLVLSRTMRLSGKPVKRGMKNQNTDYRQHYERQQSRVCSNVRSFSLLQKCPQIPR